MHPITPRTFLSLALLVTAPFGILSAQTGTRDKYLTFKDTLQLRIEGTRVFASHIVAPGQTLFGLSRFYGLELEELLYYNPRFKDRLPGVKDTLSIPVPRNVILAYRYPGFARWKGAPLIYRAQKGETLFQISKRHFGIPVDSLKAYNNIKGEGLKPGTPLFVGWLSTKGIPDSVRQFTGHPLWGKSHRLRSQFMQARNPETERQQQGYGTRIIAESENEELVVLHNEAPTNAVVALKNPLNNRIVFARVIGKIPPGTYLTGTVVVTSGTVARMLGVKEDRFFIRVKYPPE